MVGLLSFACFYYAQSFIGGISVILIPILLSAIFLIHIRDIEKAYIEIKENEIYVVDYYWSVKKEKHISFLILHLLKYVLDIRVRLKAID